MNLLVTLNAKFIHSSLALRSLRANSAAECEILELTINHRREQILEQVYIRKPDILGISCYIWNIEQLLELADDIKKILPNLIVIAGGPEAAYDPEYLLREHCVDVVVTGEGETAFAQLAAGFEDLHLINGIAFIENGNMICTPIFPEDINCLRFPYNGFDDLENRIIYYESARGCPYSCAYCLSAAGAGVRRLNAVDLHLRAFLDYKPPQVKFIDRTFNAEKSHAKNIWNYLIAHDNGVTNFHFEISGELLDEELIDLLSQARPGLFQFEIGVQTTNPDTLKAINRKYNLDTLFQNTARLIHVGNIHIHLDLIAGLPYENWDSFKKSFDHVYSLAPHQLQLGILKLLKGSPLRADAEIFGIKYCGRAPYEVLETFWLSFDEVIALKQIAEVVDIYYNSGQFRASLSYLITFFESAFDFYYALAKFRGNGLGARGKAQVFSDLFKFGTDVCNDDVKLRELMRFDMCLNEHPRALPQWLKSDIAAKTKKNLVPRRADIGVERFNYTVDDWFNGGTLDETEIYLQFIYGRRNPVINGVNCDWSRVVLRS